MRSASATKRLGGAMTVAAAMAAATAGPAFADKTNAPACAATLAAADAGTTGSCDFTSPTKWSVFAFATDGNLTARVRCVQTGGTIREYTRSYVGPGEFAWVLYTDGNCTLTLTSDFPGTTGAGTAAPFIDPYGPPA